MMYLLNEQEEKNYELKEYDRKQYVTAFNRRLSEYKARKKKNEKMNNHIPVYCSRPDRKLSAPPNSLVVNVETRKVFAVPLHFPTMLDKHIKPVCVITKQVLVRQMKALCSPPKKLSCLVFCQADEKAVIDMFRFYLELEGKEARPDIIRMLARSPPLNEKHPLIKVGRAVEARLFLMAALFTVDTFPENEITRQSLMWNVLNKPRIPYVVLSVTNMKMFNAKRPVVVSDVERGVYVIKPTPLIPRRRYRGVKRNMAFSTYINLTTLYEQHPAPPQLVVFVTDIQEGVEAMIDFYESMPVISKVHCHVGWKDLGRICGAVSFEECCEEEQ